MIGWAKTLGAAIKEDSAKNILLSIPASPGKEAIPSLVIQGHLDIVAVGEFEEKGKVPVKIVNGQLTSGVSTLGADDGIAIAAMFALLETKDQYVHGPLEFLITMDEEVGLLGAGQMDGPPFLQSRSMLNLDSEDWGKFFTSCAGGIGIFYDYLATRDSFEGTTLKVHLSSFMSGHTGLVIHEERCNAVKWMSRLLLAARARNICFRLVSIAGGDKHNAIPGSCTAEVVVRNVDDFKNCLQKIHTEAATEVRALEVKKPQLAITEITPSTVPMSRESTDKVVNLLAHVHHGVFMRHPEIPGLVNTSQSMSIVTTNGDKLTVQVFARTNEATQMEWLMNQAKSFGDLCGVATRIPENDIMGPWPAALDSRILSVAKKTYKKLFGTDPEVCGIHAGLECGAIQNRGYADLEAISIGPQVGGAHTVEECTSISTSADCYRLTLEIVKEWADRKSVV